MSKYKLKRKQTPKQQFKAEAKKINWKLHGITLLAVLLIFGIYQLCVYLGFKYIVHIYAVLLFLFALAFGIMNQGFSGKKLTPDDLPSEWDEAKKQAFLTRRKKAKYFLIPLIGIMLTFAFDIIYLFYIDPAL